MAEKATSETNKLLSADHSELDELLGRVFQALDAGNIKEIYKRLDFFRARLAMHIRAEHLHLFPAVLNAIELQFEIAESEKIPSAAIIISTVERLQDDHNFFMRELLGAIKLMRGLRESGGENKQNFLSIVREKVRDVYKRLEAHNEKEESKVYRWADALLDAAEGAALSEKMQRESYNLPLRFADSGLNE